MKCCINCFADQELKAIIRSNSTASGTCNYCKTKNAVLANPREFENMFMQLSQSYENVGDDIDGINPLPFHEKIQKDWCIFSENLEKRQQRNLIQDILIDLMDKDELLLNNPVEQKVLTRNLENTHTIKKWEDFTYEIKRNNRYFIGKEIDLKLLKTLFTEFYADSYLKGKLFYRARVSDKKGYEIRKMGKPPPSKATSGRANPMGIPYLYVSTNKETVLHECRASYLDYVTIAEFKLTEKLNFVSLRKVEKVSPFIIIDGIDQYLKNQKYLKTLETELSKPLRRQDQKLDYLPTQYICEFIKSLGYDAIEYGSALFEGGVNLAVFNDEKLKPVKTEIDEVVSMDLQTKIVA